MDISLKIKITDPRVGVSVPTPEYATPGSAALDLCACIDGEQTIEPMKSALISTGIAIELPSPSYVALLFARSGLAVKNGISLANGVGVIDSDYRGEVRVCLVNHSDKSYTLKAGDRIAQLALLPVCRAVIETVANLGGSERGDGGFGSTGR